MPSTTKGPEPQTPRGKTDRGDETIHHALKLPLNGGKGRSQFMCSVRDKFFSEKLLGLKLICHPVEGVGKLT